MYICNFKNGRKGALLHVFGHSLSLKFVMKKDTVPWKWEQVELFSRLSE